MSVNTAFEYQLLLMCLFYLGYVPLNTIYALGTKSQDFSKYVTTDMDHSCISFPIF